jgi:hypothetical protein
MLDVTSEVTCMTTETPQLGPLSAMVKELLESGMSTRILAARTYDEASAQEVLKKDFWSLIARDALAKVPNASQLEWMALAMRRPVDVIRAAASAQYLGYEPVHLSGYDDDTRRIIVQVTAASPDRRRELRVMLEAAAEDKSAN